jgi:serine/threonine protein kinase
MDQIGRYKILGEVGRGAMGVVYRAQDPAIGRVVAIKTIRLGDLADPSERLKLRDRLLREAQSAGILSHPGIVTIYDVAEQDDLAYIAMEFVDGPTLERLMIQDPPDGKAILDILTQTAAALDYAHRRGIVHRDIKPANIMLQERSIVKITDFGVARIQSSQITQIGSMVGTPNYMSPEQIQGREVDGRSDQFSLAVIAYELLTGEKPFVADSIPSLAFKIVQEEPQPVHRLNLTLGWPVDTVLKRALTKDPAGRYPTCIEFIFAVENACKSSKGWKPNLHRSTQSLPTLGVAAPAIPPAVSAPPVTPPPVPPPPPVRPPSVTPPSDKARPAAAPPIRPPVAARIEPPNVADSDDFTYRTPWPLRVARTVALIAVGAGVIAIAIVAALRVFDRDASQTPARVQDETQMQTGPAYDKPSAMPPDNATEPPTSLPEPEPPQQPPPALAEVKPLAEPAPARPDTIRLVTNPQGANLVVDRDPGLACTAPCALELTPGRHTIEATMSGYRRALKIFHVPEAESVFLHLERASGTVLVNSNPQGATVIVDGRESPNKTPVMLTLPTGQHTIEFVHENRRETHEVVVEDSVVANIAVDLKGP